MNTAHSSTPFQSIQEWDNSFLALFPHRFDYIWAEHPNPGTAVEWKTESRHPLSDRLIQQGSYLYGVRFGAQTQYCLLDIDIHSPYHPRQDPLALSRLIAALEPIGLVRPLCCTSSNSGGLHLYFPFIQAQSCWQLAIAIASLLENTGFKLHPGQLELFPDPKPYSNNQYSLFNAHRLPLQIGSYLVNSEYQPIWSTQHTFVQQWHLAQDRNEIDTDRIKQILKQAKRRHFRISGKADKFLNDLNAEIELGWTSYGQTNRLLGRITMRAYIFHHVLAGGEPLAGQALVEEIVETARSLPGYQEWCRHQHEIEHRAEEWMRCIENSHYFHYGDPEGKFKAKVEISELEEAIEQAPSWNQQQSAAARDRIRGAIADLLEKSTLPTKATARFRSLLSYGIGGASLYRHRDLWHPNHLATTPETETENNQQTPPSLFPEQGGDATSSQGSSDRTLQNDDSSGGNQQSDRASLNCSEQDSYSQAPLLDLQTWQSVQQEANRHAQQQRRRLKRQASQAKQVARMQQFLASDDPILVAEAMAWAAINPGILTGRQLSFFEGTIEWSGEDG